MWSRTINYALCRYLGVAATLADHEMAKKTSEMTSRWSSLTHAARPSIVVIWVSSKRWEDPLAAMVKLPLTTQSLDHRKNITFAIIRNSIANRKKSTKSLETKSSSAFLTHIMQRSCSISKCRRVRQRRELLLLLRIKIGAWRWKDWDLKTTNLRSN